MSFVCVKSSFMINLEIEPLLLKHCQDACIPVVRRSRRERDSWVEWTLILPIIGRSTPYLEGSSGLSVCKPVYPGALDVIRRIILSDGDVVFQPLKIERSGLWAAVEGRVLIYIHKEKMLDAVAERYPGPALRDDR